MAIFPGGKSTRINSPRHLTIRHSRRVTAAHRREARRLLGAPALADDWDETDPLPPGEQKLNSFWAPGLEAGARHRIGVKQSIGAGGESLLLEAEQDFFVDAPQFSLPQGSVHSTYPPAGYSDDHRILPHVVLTDPHLPWERLGSPKAGTNKELKARMAAKAGQGAVRNRVPWLAVLSFSMDELRLPPEALDGAASIFGGTGEGVIKPVKQSATMTVNMSVADLWKLTSDVATPVSRSLGPESIKDSRGDFVLVPPDLFTSLFSAFDKDGNRVSSAPDTGRYQFLSHVRKINGSGMALAGVEDTAVFSIVVGGRSGELDAVGPTTTCAHLVSIEGVEAMGSFPASQGKRYVALCSLHSWNYTVLPPNTVNVPDAFEHLGRTLDVLRAPEAVVAPLRTSGDRMKQLVGRRLDDGYTLVRYRTQTGEPTLALYRGPLTPSYVPPLEHLTSCSGSSVDLQILDRGLGIMDVTYAVAWQLGRTMALGDEAFAAALGRLRSAIHGAAADAAKLQVVKDIDEDAVRTREELLGDLAGMAKSLAGIHLGDDRGRGAPAGPGEPRFGPGGAKRRWFRPKLGRRALPDLSFASPSMQSKYPAAALKAARSLARSTSGELYDETNDPQSTDWMLVLSWLVDRMFLAGVPAHCLLPDPTYLEPESLRFFRIDANWVDALVDGALSLGNHFGVDEDRVAIKKALNDYINHTPAGQGHRVQVPAYGFFLRSDLVTMFPDLRVEVLADDAALRSAGQDPPAGAPLLRHDIVTDGVMMALMDRVPGSSHFASLVLTQPSHQQRFAVARGLDTTHLKVDIRRQYTVDQATRERDGNRHDALEQVVYHAAGDASSDGIFLWDSQPGKGLNELRMLRLPRFADLQLSVLRDRMGSFNDAGTTRPYFDDHVATSALFGMQLNDPIYNLTIDLRARSPTAGRLTSLGQPGGGGGTPELRTLRLLGTARVKRLTSADDGRAPSPRAKGQMADEDADKATFERPENYTPTRAALANNLAPHVRALPACTEAALGTPAVIVSRGKRNATMRDQSDLEPLGSEPASSPSYLMRIGSNEIGRWEVITLEPSNIAQDLIFSVVLRQSEVSQYMLMEVAIQIELGENANDPRPFLMQNYTGPGAHMLTNLRFNVLPTHVIDNNNRNLLRLRLLPRAAKGWVNVTAVRELSFLLGLASINAPNKREQEFRVQSWADYCRNPDQPLGPVNTCRITNPDTVVKVVNPRFQ